MRELSSAIRSSKDKHSSALSDTQPGETCCGNFYTPENSNFYSSFRYMDLDSEGCAIRLLRIKPPHSSDTKQAPISCDLLDNVPLSTVKGKYTTISYSAGDLNEIERIVVNGLPFNAFSNLGHALRQARHFWRDNFDKQELLLWADQVCINQNNYLERSQQVKIMGDIYAAAQQVLISLSTENDIGGGIEWLHQLSLDPKDYEASDEYELPHGVFKDKWDDESFHLGWNAFISTCLTSSWWSRAWVRQEFIRSPQAYFIAAFQSIHWRVVADFIDIYYNAVYALDMPAPAFLFSSSQSAEHLDSCKVCLLGNDSSKFWEAGKRAYRLLAAKPRTGSCQDGFGDLLENLSDAHLCESSDPRDLIYAFLGFSDHGYDLNPDYSHNIYLQDVLCHLARNVISHNSNLDILELAYLTHGQNTEPDIPSWVPDWRNTKLYHEGHFEKTRTSYKTTFFSFHPDDRGRKDRVLQVKGFLCQVLGPPTSGWIQYRQYLSTTGKIIPTVGHTEDDDEVWMLHGTSSLFILRQQEHCYQVVGEVLDKDGVIPEVHPLIEEVKELGKRNDATLRLINII
jgi:hypothetical protein